MACHTPPLKKAKRQGEMPFPALSSIPSLNSPFYEFGWDQGWVIQEITFPYSKAISVTYL